MKLTGTNINLGDIETKGAMIYGKTRSYKSSIMLVIIKTLLEEGKNIALLSELGIDSVENNLAELCEGDLTNILNGSMTGKLHVLYEEYTEHNLEKLYLDLKERSIDTVIIDDTKLSNVQNLNNLLKAEGFVPIITQQIMSGGTHIFHANLEEDDFIERIFLDGSKEAISQHNLYNKEDTIVLIRTNKTNGVKALKVENRFNFKEAEQLA